MLPYAQTADDEAFTGQPFIGQTWRRWASNAQSMRQGRGRVVAAGYCYQPLGVIGISNYLDVPFQAPPWEQLYRVRAVIATRTPLDGLTADLFVSSFDTAGASLSANQPGTRFSLMLEGETQDGSQPTATQPPAVVQWPVLPSMPPQLTRLQSGWLTHEPSAALLLLRDRVIRLQVVAAWAPGSYLAGYVIEGYSDEEVI
jgi:hypothetical protein